MLCGDCEDLFSEKETWFANKIFHPYLKKEKTIFDYDENLAYFITSVNWRSLYLDILDFVENSVVGIDALECLIESEKIMNEFLREKRNDLGKIENHIFFFDDIKELSVGASNFADLKPHATFHRGIGSYTFCYEDEKTYGTLTNMMGVILVTLYHKGQREVWNNTEILNGVGRIEAKDQQIQSVFGNELIHIMETAKKASEAMSVAQQKKAGGDNLIESVKLLFCEIVLCYFYIRTTNFVMFPRGKPHIFFFCIGTLIDYFCSGMLVGSPVHFVLYLFEEQDRAFCMGIIINAGSIDFQNFSPEYFF